MRREPTEMELRVANALFPHMGNKAWPEEHLEVARLAIRAMPPATTEMLREAGLNSSTRAEHMAEDFQAMIDAASPPS